MVAANLDSADLKAALSAPGLIREDVMNKIFEIDDYILEYVGRVRKSSVDNSYAEWTTEELAAPNAANKWVDGADITGNATKVGERVGNHCQICATPVRVSDRADASDGIGDINSLAHQLKQRGREIRRDQEAIALGLQGSVADDGGSTAGQTASVFAWMKTNVATGATGTHTGFNTGTKVVAAATAGTKRALSEKLIRDAAQQIYLQTGQNRKELILMCRPEVYRLIDEYLFTSTARVASMVEDIGKEPGTAVGVVDKFKADFGYLTLVPNILLPTSAAGASPVGVFDFEYLEMGMLKDYYIRELATTGLAQNRFIAVDWCNKVLNEKAIAGIFDIDHALPMTLT